MPLRSTAIACAPLGSAGLGYIRLCACVLGYIRLCAAVLGCVRLRSAVRPWAQLCPPTFNCEHLGWIVFGREFTVLV